MNIYKNFFSPPFQIELESRKLLNPHMKEHHPEKGGCCIECEEFMSVSINDFYHFKVCHLFHCNHVRYHTTETLITLTSVNSSML